MQRLPRILICDDDSLFQMSVKAFLKGRYECLSAFHGDEALAILRNQSIDLLMLDVQIRTEDEGLNLIPRILEQDPRLAIIMSSGRKDFETVREAMRRGAVDYVPKDADPNELLHVLQRVLERRRLIESREQQAFEAGLHQRKHVLIGQSPLMQDLRRQIDKIRLGASNVVIAGETGTGKEVVARQLRKTLPDGAFEPFIAVDSATIQSSTAESILFGHEKGAFTGADRQTKGVFEEAHGGIVYFDEIANMSLEIQAKLLRVLQEKEVRRMGSARSIPLEFRVICATNRDLEGMVRAGQFKDDLVQRLSVLPIAIPPLRERKQDIEALVRHFVEQQQIRGRKIAFAPSALECLAAYDWPGNIRELSNIVAYVTTMADSDEIEASDLPPKLRDALTLQTRRGVVPSEAREKGASTVNFYEEVAHFEKELLAGEYARADGNISKLALRLEMDRSHLYTKLREYGIHPAKSADRR